MTGSCAAAMQGSATMSCVDDKNLNAHEVHNELVTVDISESLAQLQELQESSSIQSHFWVILLMIWRLVKVPR